LFKRGENSSPRGDNCKRGKTLKILEILFSRTNRLISIKFGTNDPWIKGIQVKGYRSSSKG
jgi:hypothetical protein